MQPSTVQVDDDIQSLLGDPGGSLLQETLPRYLLSRRWFGGKARDVRSVEVIDSIPVPYGASTAHIVLARTRYAAGEPETYVAPVAHAAPERKPDLPDSAVIARLIGVAGDRGLLYDAMVEPGFTRALLDAIDGRQVLRGRVGKVAGSPTGTVPRVLRDFNVRADQLEQTNTSVVLGGHLILKLYRRLGDGVNPELEIGRFLAEHGTSIHVPPLVGALEYLHGASEPVTLAVLQGYVPNEGDAWHFTLDALQGYFQRVPVRSREVGDPAVPSGSVLDLCGEEPPRSASEMIGSYLEAARLLGQRTAELHLALSSDVADPAFTPEPFSANDRRSLYESMQTLAAQSFQLLRRHSPNLPEETRADARQVLDLETAVVAHFRSALERHIEAQRIRCHGDYHLGQILYTGTDFVIIDFEGEPARPVRERRIKRSPVGDIAGLLRSFHYAAYSALPTGENGAALQPWAASWYSWVSATFLRAYLKAVAPASLLPKQPEELDALLGAFLLEKAVYELGYELNNRPSWSHIPLRGILELMSVRG
jgi:maltose alpha-D-glucosyltransferase/alpha-amylase